MATLEVIALGEGIALWMTGYVLTARATRGTDAWSFAVVVGPFLWPLILLYKLVDDA